MEELMRAQNPNRSLRYLYERVIGEVGNWEEGQG